MKLRIILSCIAAFFACNISEVNAQAAWIEPENPDVTQTVRIYCDISKATSAESDNMKSNTDGPYYIWTWKPTEAERVDSLQNGTGDKPWKSSNETLKMTKDPSKGSNVWYYEMIPTQFYNCDANTVYTKDISFLVKPKDGGGYGDPDVKTEDFNVAVNPPKLDRGILYSVPQILLENELTSLIYDNPLETKTTMQNLNDGDVCIHMIATIKDTSSGVTSTIEPSKFLQVQNNPKLKMKKMSDGRFKITMIPRKFFNVTNPNAIIQDVTITVRKTNWATSADQTNETSKLKFGCN